MFSDKAYNYASAKRVVIWCDKKVQKRINKKYILNITYRWKGKISSPRSNFIRWIDSINKSGIEEGYKAKII